MTYTKSGTFKEFIDARERGELCQIDEYLYRYFLDVLPPRFMRRMVKLVSGREVYADFGFAEGADRITAFWSFAGAYFAQHTTLFSRGD